MIISVFIAPPLHLKGDWEILAMKQKGAEKRSDMRVFLHKGVGLTKGELHQKGRLDMFSFNFIRQNF